MKQYSRNGSKCALLVVCLALVLIVNSGASDATRREWVFVDTTVAGYQDLVDDLLAGGHDGRRLELVLLDGRRDGIEQIAESLAGQSAADAIHLITHGSQAELQLGTARLTANSMFGEYADALSKIGLALTEGGDLLVYGCNFGRGAFGRQAATRLADLTGADIAASDDLTGAQALGGDWNLEVATGTIESAIAVSTRAQSNWGGLLVTPVIIARETVDSNDNGQIDQIKITTDQNLDDDFAGLTITVSGYPVTGYTSDIANDTIFYVNLTESGSPDTGATPTVTVRANTTLSEDGGGNNIVTDPNWWNPAWQDRNKITFDNTNSAEDLIDFPVLVSLNPSDLPGLDLSAVVGADVRFIDGTTGAELKYEVEGWDGAADTATVWVKVPQIDGSSNTDHVWVYYNYNGAATYDQSAVDEQAVWDPNYAGVWHLNEATGATVIDATNNSNDGTPEAGPAEASTGKIGGALDFNVVGPSTRIEIPADASLDLTLYTTWTMSAWVKPTSYVGTKWPTVYQYGSPGHATLGVAAQETTDGIIEHWQNDSTAVHGTNPATFNDWNHIAIVRDATNTTFYLNGSPDGSGASVTINDGEKSWIGGTENNSPGDDDFLGLIDEVRVSAGSNSDFSADWIKAQYLSTTGAFNTFGSEEIATDMAAPVIVSATSTVGSTTLTVTFSEAVDTSNAGAGDLVASDFSYTDVSGGGAASVSSMWPDADGTDNVVTITVNAAFNSGDFYTDTIAAASTQIYDLADIAAGTTTVAITTDIKISSAANQTFIVGDPVTPAAIITITESATTATITRKNDLRIRIPASFNMTWDTSVTDVTIGGGTAGKVKTKLRKYEDAGKTAVVDVSADFSVGDQITIDGLTFMSFVAPSPADNLELEVGRDGVVTAEDDKTITIGAGGNAVLSSGTNQIFSVGNPSTPMSPISVSDAATATITAANDIRIRIPAAFNMTWDSGITTATLGGSAAAKVNASVSFEDGVRTLVLTVNTDFADSDTLAISGLNYLNFTAVSAADNLELEIDNLGGVIDEDDKTIVVSDVRISSAAPQTFTVGDPSTAASTITITDGTSASIRKKEDLRIRIPAGVDMAWDTSVVSVTLGGAAAGKVKADLKNYEDNGKTAVIDIQDDCVGSDQFTIDGLAFMGFATPSGPGRLELETGNDDIVVDVDDKTITIIAGPTNILSANDQTFNLGNPPTPIATITVTDGATPAITAANDLRIRIPGGFNMTWDSSDVTAVIGGPAAAKVSNTVGYENVNQTLLVTVNTDFAAGEWITISGLSFANYTANSPADNLELVTDGAAQTEIDRDDKTILVTDLTITSAASQSFTVGDASTLAATITITDDTVSATITNKKDLRIRIPSTFPMKWDPTITNVTVGGAAAAKVKTKLKNYEDGGRTAVVNVSADFVAGDQVTIADLRFVDFAAPAVFDNLELEVFKDGLLSALDDKTVNIVAGPVNILSDEDQSFGFSDIATTISPITVTDAATPAITAANDIRIRIPAAIEIVWDGAATTAILGGPAASKVSGTVSYEDLGKTLVLDVTADFAAGDHIVIAGLRYTGFAPPSGLDFLELLIDGGTVVIDTDDHSLSLHGAFISSALDQTFIVNEAPKQAETITITDDTVIRTIKKKKDLRIRIPADFPMTWDTSITTVTLGGGAQNKVSATLKAYEDNGQTVVLDVEKDFAAGEVLTIDGLFFANFSLPSLAVPVTDTLELEVGNDGSVAATDVKTITVDPGPTTLTSVSDQVFYVGDGPTPASILTIINDSALTQIKKKTDIRVTIPAAVDMTWDPSVVTITVGGNAWDKVKNAVTYENVGGKPKILVIDVSGDFGTGDYITVDGLSFRDFLAPVGAGNLLLTADPGPVDTDDFFVAVVELGLSSASSQSFFVSDPPAAASTFTVSDDAVTPQITALDDIRIRIPAGFNMTWDSAESAVTLGGSATAKVDTQILAYEDLDHTLVLDVTTDFTAGDTLTVNGVQFANFTAASAADNLELEVYNDDNPKTLDDKTITVATPVSPTLLSAFDQVFLVGAPVTSAATLTIANGTGAAIKDADNIRVRIPAGFNMSWDTSVGTVTLGGSASGKVNVNLLPYENGGRMLVLEVTADFTAGEFITVSGLAFTGFAAPSAATNLELLVAGGAGSVVDDDDRYIVVTDASLSSAGIQFFAVGSAPTPIRELTITNDSAFNAITAGNDIRIRIPPGFNMLWDVSDTSAVLGGSAQALVSSTVSFVDFGRTLVLNVTSDFAPSDTLTVRELSFAQFTDVSPSDYLELELGNDNVVTALDDETITIVTATYRSIGTTTGNLYTGLDATAAAGVSIIDFPSAAFGIDVGRGDRLVINPGGGATQEVLFIFNRLSPTQLETQKATVLDHSGGDPYEIRRVYNALQDWESDRGGDLKGESRLEVGVAYNDDVFLESLVIDGSTTDATHFMRLEVAQGHGHNATDGTGVTIDGQNGGFSGILIQDDFTQVGGFELTRHRGADVAAIVVDSATNVILNRLLIHDFEDFSNNVSAVEASLNANFTLRNCVIFDGDTAVRSTEVTGSGTVQNCSIHRMLDYGVYEDQGVINVVNTIAMDSGAIDFDVVLGSQTTNVSSDGTGTFTASAINQFVSIVPGAEDYHLAATAAASIDAGTDLPAQFLHDIDGDVRAGTPWDIGADEFGAIVQTTLLTSASDQVFFVGASETPAAVITVTDAAAGPVINTAGDIRIRIPATPNMAWDMADMTAIMGGPAASKVSTTVSYADPKTLVIEVLTDFAASDYITVDGLSFAGFTGVSLPDSLELLVDGVSVIAVDDKTLTVTGPSMSSLSNQSFIVGSPAIVANQISILEDASAPSIFASDDIRIRIPPGFPMRWDASVPLVTLSGSAAVNVSAVPTYEDGGKTLVLNVTTDFLAGDVLTVDGAAFVGFVAPAAPVPLELEAHNDGTLSALDDKTKAVVADAIARVVSEWDQIFFESDSSTVASPIHVTDGTTASITGTDIRIRIPAGLDMEWDMSVGSVGVSGGASGKVSSIVAYEDLNKTVVVSVTTDFAASDHVTFSGLSFKTFIESPPGSLELEVLNDDAVTSTDPRTITIGPKNEVLVFTAKSTSTENRLEWLNPPSVPYVQTWIRAREDGVFPTGPFDGRLVVGQAGGLGATDWFVDVGRTNGTTVHYAAFVDRGGGVFSDPATTTGRPFDHVSGPVKWAYSTNATSMAPPGIRFSGGVATVFAVSNDEVLHSMYGGAGGGDWPPAWKPYQFKAPAQARPPVVGFTIGSATNGAALIGSQDGSVYVIDADNGSEAWKSTIAGMVQAAPAGEFTAYGGDTDLVLIGTRDAAGPNAFVALNVPDGTQAWDFQNRLGPPENGDGLEIGIISGGASIDYATNRAYFASRQATAESQNTLWCISFTGAQPTLEWARDIGDVDGSPILFNGVIYVGTVAGFVYAYDTSGTQLWSNTTLSDGPVKGFIFPQFGSPNVLLSTNTKVWSLDATGVPNWSVPLPSPSIPLFAWGTSYVIVGAGDGKLYQIDANNPALITSATLGDGSPTSVGAPSLDLLNSVIYVGTDAGIIYAVDFPLP